MGAYHDVCSSVVRLSFLQPVSFRHPAIRHDQNSSRAFVRQKKNESRVLEEQSKAKQHAQHQAKQSAKHGACRDEDGPEEANRRARSAATQANIHPPAPVVSPTSLMSLARRGSRTYRARALLSTRVATLDIWLHSLAQLLQQERPLKPHLHDRAVEAHSSGSGFFVGGFDFVQTALELDAFSVVGLFDAGSERCAGSALRGYCLMVNQCGLAEKEEGRVVRTDWRHVCGFGVARK